MSTPELEDLIARYFEGELGADDEARLNELLELHPEAFRRFKGLVSVEGLLRARETEAGRRDSLGDRVRESVRSEEQRRRLTNRVMKSLKGFSPQPARATPVGGSAPWRAVAACLVLGASVALAFLLRPSDPAAAPPSAPAVSRDSARPPRVAPAPVTDLPAPPAPSRPDPIPSPAPGRPRPEPPRTPPPSPKPPPEIPKPEPSPPPPPSPPAPRPAPPTRPTTVATAHVRLEETKGRVFVLKPDGREAAVSGPALSPGWGLETAPRDSSARLVYRDGTRLDVSPGTTIRALETSNPAGARKRVPGKRVVLEKGTLRAVVATQPDGEPMRIAAPHGEIRVLGTSLRVSVTPDPRGQTVVRVDEGRVRLTRTWDGDSIELTRGQFAVAAPNVELAPRTVRTEEIVLLPRDGRLVGDEWRLVPERRATSRLALETRSKKYRAAAHVSKRPSYVSFTFYAEADREYFVWVRGFSVPQTDQWERDQLNIHVPGATFNQECAFGHKWEDAYTYAGFSEASTFTWIGRNRRNTARDENPVSVRFDTPGPKTLRLFAAQPWIRVDAVWLSASRTSRPDAKTPLPLRSGR